MSSGLTADIRDQGQIALLELASEQTSFMFATGGINQQPMIRSRGRIVCRSRPVALRWHRELKACELLSRNDVDRPVVRLGDFIDNE